MFVALCLSFSSTALVIKFLNDDTGEDVMDLRLVEIGFLVLHYSHLFSFLDYCNASSQYLHHGYCYEKENGIHKSRWGLGPILIKPCRASC